MSNLDNATILNFILENAPAYIVQEAVQEFSLIRIAYKMRLRIISQFPELRGQDLSFGIKMSEVFAPFYTEPIFFKEIDGKIGRLEQEMRLLGKWHPEYMSMAIYHDKLVEINNTLNEPITAFLKLYKKAQKKAKGKKISVVNKKGIWLPKPVGL